MAVSDHLTIFEEPGLRRPIIIMAFCGLERRGRVGHDRGPLPGPALARRGTSQHRPGGVLPLRPVPPLRALQAGLARPSARSSGRRPSSPLAQPAELERDIMVGVAIEPHLKWRTYCARGARAGAALRVVAGPHARRAAGRGAPHPAGAGLAGSAYDPELAARLGVRPTPLRGTDGDRRRAQHRLPRGGRSRRRASGPTSRTTSRASRTRRPRWPSCAAC